MDLKNKKVVVIGAARSGVAVANAVVRLGGMAKISDIRSLERVQEALGGIQCPQQVTIECGGHTREFIDGCDLLVLSPGVRRDIDPVQWAMQAGIEVIGEIEFAWRLCLSPVVAVTGSNGKTTTVTLIAQILAQADRGVVACGNIGKPFSECVLDLKPTDTVVLEISSFQLESIERFKPHVAVWLNFSPNHLDRHKDLQEYFEAKKRIFANQDKGDWAILNAQQPELKDLAGSLNARVVFFNDQEAPGVVNPNYLAAMAAAKVLGVSEDVCKEVFAGFKGVEHRLEWVRTIDGVDYINDSKATTPQAGQWALTHLNKPVVMICGGSDKHLDFSPLCMLVKNKVKKMIVIGQTKEALRATFMPVVPIESCGSLPQAIEAARSSAQHGDCVLLSPMCASFDMFNDYEHRGRVFKEAVLQLK